MDAFNKFFLILMAVTLLVVGSAIYMEDLEQTELENSIQYQKGYSDYPNDTLYNEVISTGYSDGIFVDETLYRYRKGWEQAKIDDEERIEQLEYDKKIEYADSVIEKIND